MHTVENSIIINQIVLKGLKSRVRTEKEAASKRVSAVENAVLVNYMIMNNITNGIRKVYQMTKNATEHMQKVFFFFFIQKV